MFNSQRLRNLRKDLKLTQLEISEKLSITQSSYSKYETNQADLNLELLQRLNDIFGIDPNEFILNQGSPVEFKNDGTVNGNGVVQSQNYYEFPKEVIDVILSNQKYIIDIVNNVIKGQAK